MKRDDGLEWTEFAEGEEPELLLGISAVCDEGQHTDCPGFGPSDEHGGETMFCVCACHKVSASEVPV